MSHRDTCDGLDIVGETEQELGLWKAGEHGAGTPGRPSRQPGYIPGDEEPQILVTRLDEG